ncbi:MAG: methyltransferase domain-containing protein [bacterium]|nr:methyltransferase domain-containing protein [bacterium]
MSAQNVSWDSTNPAMFKEKMYPFYYAVYAAMTRGYHHPALAAATLADFMLWGLRGRRVLELGCGYGISTQAIANFAPREILAIDQSPEMIRLLRHIFLGDELETPLESDFMRRAMGRYYQTLLDHVVWQKSVFANGIFCRNHRLLHTKVSSGLSLSPDDEGVGIFDAVILNHSFHWLVGDLLTATEPNRYLISAVSVAWVVKKALERLSLLLKSGGVLVFATMEGFVEDDINWGRDKDWRENGVRSHPVLSRFETRLRELLMERCGLDEKDEKPRPKLFPLSTMRNTSRMAGFSLEHVSCQEGIEEGDALEAAFTGDLMLLGSYEIPWEEQLRLIQQVYDELEPVISKEERRQPVRPQSVIFCLKKKD